jgi:peptidoglycan L-alanyl-D-glutamate endopeptidase CwlK
MALLGKRSLDSIKDIDPRLTLIIGYVLAEGKVDFTVTEGLRSAERQQKLYAEGKSQRDGIHKKSYHQSGRAFDFIPYPFKGWEDIESFKKVGEELKKAASKFGFEYQYGGDWHSFKDYPHFQIK